MLSGTKTPIGTDNEAAERIARTGIWHWRNGMDACRWSAGMYGLFGWPIVRGSGRMPGFEKALTPTSWQGFQAAAQRCRGDGRSFEFIAETRAGSPVRWVSIRGGALRDARGEMIGLAGAAQDITAQQRVEQALRESEERYRAVVEDQTDLIIRFLVDGTITFVNEVYCRFFGQSSEDLVGKRWQPIALPDDVPMIEARLRTLSPENNVVTVENRVYAADGCVRWMQFVNRAFFDGNGSVVEMQAVGRDITRRKEIEAALHAANEHLERRVAERTAELRQLAHDATLAEEHERRAVARDLHDDLGQLLHVAKIRLGQIGKCNLDEGARSLLAGLDELCGEASARVRSLTAQLSPPALEKLGLVPSLSWLADEMARSYGLRVDTLDDGCDKPLSHVQSAILFRAARELLINVVKHAKSDGATVATRRDGGCIELCVADRGVGIDGSAAALREARGFGLPSIRERIEFLGGSLGIEPVPGGGASVTLRLPLDIAEKAR